MDHLTQLISSHGAQFQRQMASSVRNMATGQRSDAVGSAIAQRMSQEAARADVGATNGRMAMSYTNSAYNAMGQAQDIVSRMDELATRASDPMLSAQDRSVLQVEADALNGELNDLVGNAQFNGQSLLQGGSMDTEINGRVTLDRPYGTRITGALSGFDLSDPSAAQSMVSHAQGMLNEERARLDATGSRVARAISGAHDRSANLSEAAAAHGSIDLAKEVGRFMSAMASRDTNMAVQRAHNISLSSISDLLT